MIFAVINGENAAYKAPKFSKSQTRTRNALIDDIMNDFNPKKPEKEDDDAYVAPSPTSPIRRASFLPNANLLRRKSSQVPAMSAESDGLVPMVKTTSSRSAISQSSDDLDDALGSSGGGFLRRMRTRKSKQINAADAPEVEVRKSAEGIDDTDGYVAPLTPSDTRKQSIFRIKR